MRGKLKPAVADEVSGRITPAHAGKTRNSHSSTFRSRDHPRACGENLDLKWREIDMKGSPPRMRGKLTQCGVGAGREGITPAHAGKTLLLKRLRTERRDHPRACGENRLSPPRKQGKVGSPPRMRGKPLNAFSYFAKNGITPAHAGKTCDHRPNVAVFRDHPRACGENLNKMLHDLGVQGSPPRMRGKLVSVM